MPANAGPFIATTFPQLLDYKRCSSTVYPSRINPVEERWWFTLASHYLETEEFVIFAGSTNGEDSIFRVFKIPTAYLKENIDSIDRDVNEALYIYLNVDTLLDERNAAGLPFGQFEVFAQRLPEIGAIADIPEGTEFGSRRELSNHYVHRPLQAGIWGTRETGAYSIVPSGGYEDDEDHGDEIIYTGQGGRDPETHQQISDQKLTAGNAALAKSHIDGLPVRVIRGYTHESEFSPAAGYRYDGLYRVDDYWLKEGVSGYKVWRYRLIKLESDESQSYIEPDLTGDGAVPERREVTTVRIVRDSRVSRKVKELYRHKCQVCGTRIETPGGPYAEGAHIRPLGGVHRGSDTLSNILCLCPNHHVMFDNLVFTISDDGSLIGLASVLNVHRDHNISIENLRYHREHRYKNPQIP